MLENSINSIWAFIQKPERVCEGNISQTLSGQWRVEGCSATRRLGTGGNLLPLVLRQGWETAKAATRQVSLPPLGGICVFEEFS